MRSFISSFDRRAAMRIGLITLVAFLLGIAPMEIAVRAVERSYGTMARFGYPGTDAAKLAWFLDIARQSKPARVLTLGNSQAEYGLHPGVLAEALGIDEAEVYNLSFSGTSALSGLELVERHRLTPELIVICVSPADLSRPMIERGEKLLAASLDGAGDHHERLSWRPALEAWLARSYAGIVRSADPRYRRSLADYLALVKSPAGSLASLTDVGRFVTTGRVAREPLADGRYHIRSFERGFLGLDMLKPWSKDDFERLAVAPSEVYYQEHIFPSYLIDGPQYWGRLADKIAGLKRANTRVVLLRMPVYQPFFEVEERATRFAATLETFAHAHEVQLISQRDLPPDFATTPTPFRDAAHLHAASALSFSRWVGERIRAGF
jgi:hypothetical protein